MRRCMNLWLLVCLSAMANSGAIYEDLVVSKDSLEFPPLPYPYNALVPHVDEATMKVHHQGHHKTYTDNANKALKEWRDEESTSSLARSSIVTILQRIFEVPQKWQTAVRNSGGGFANHCIYWASICPGGGGVPSGNLLKKIEDEFSSFSFFKERFTSEALKLFGSGYVWLSESVYGNLTITTSKNQDSPLSEGLYPILVIDIWEHAYYLKHQNKRANYIQSWWEVVCWREVDELRQFWHHQPSYINKEDYNKHTHTHVQFMYPHT